MLPKGWFDLVLSVAVAFSGVSMLLYMVWERFRRKANNFNTKYVFSSILRSDSLDGIYYTTIGVLFVAWILVGCLFGLMVGLAHDAFLLHSVGASATLFMLITGGTALVYRHFHNPKAQAAYEALEDLRRSEM